MGALVGGAPEQRTRLANPSPRLTFPQHAQQATRHKLEHTHDMLREHSFHAALHDKLGEHRFHLWAGGAGGGWGLGPGLGAWLSRSSLLPATSLRWLAPPARALRQITVLFRTPKPDIFDPCIFDIGVRAAIFVLGKIRARIRALRPYKGATPSFAPVQYHR